MKEMRTGRVEPRMITNTVASLEAADDPVSSETVVFVKFSEHGARFITRRRWPSGKRVIVTDLVANFRTSAEVIYCAPHSHSPRRFAVGVKFN